MKISDYMDSQLSHPRGIIGNICCYLMNIANKQLYLGVRDSLTLNKDSHVLEIGYGNGHLIKLLYQKFACKISGIDISEDIKKVASRRNKKGVAQNNIQLEIGDCCHLHFDDECFDAIVTMNTIYFWRDTKKGLNEIFRTLKTGGVFSNVIYSKDYMQAASYSKEIFKFFNPEEIETLAKEIGFKEVKVLSLKHGNAFIINCVK